MNHPVKFFDIGCRDLESAVSFYRETFDWEIASDGPLQASVTTGAEGCTGAITSLGHEPHNYVMFYVETQDIEASVKRIREQGGEITIGPLPVPSGGRFAWWKDPEGNQLGLFEPEPEVGP